jgi:hypothetical protein
MTLPTYGISRDEQQNETELEITYSKLIIQIIA